MVSPAGNLSRYIDNWYSITSNSYILNIIKNGYKIKLNSKICIPPVISTPSKKKLIPLSNEIGKHLSSGVISEVDFNESDVVSRVFTVEKPSGGHRLILDLSRLNLSIEKASFRMEDREVIKSLIHKGDFMISIDLKDAFHSIDLHLESKRLTVFQFNGKRYAYNVLPFGLTSSPRVFSQVFKSVISHLRGLGIRISSYLDDVIIISNSFDKCISDRDKTLNLLSSLGFIVNFKKSCLIPSQNLLHLGYIWDSLNMSISLPLDKFEKIQAKSRLCASKALPIRTHAALLGLLVSSCNGFKYAALHYRNFQLDFLKALRCNDSWDALWALSSEAKLDLEWWCNAKLADLSPILIEEKPTDISMFTDASLLGWGATLSSGEYISGCWNESDSKQHINFLELKAIKLALMEFLPVIKSKSILIHSDNLTTVYYINKIGGTHSIKLCLLALDIWNFIIASSISCKAIHIAGIRNNAADYLSRHSHLHEYSLSPKAFREIADLIPFRVDLDLFATSSNNKLSKFVSLFNDPKASKIDAFSFAWPSNVYAFPPIPLIPRVISKLIRDEVKFCLLITPAWGNLSILPVLKNLLISNPIFINCNHLLGSRPTRHPFHLMAWPISSPCANKKGCLWVSMRHSSRVLAQKPSLHILGTGRDLWNGLERENLNPIYLQI